MIEKKYFKCNKCGTPAMIEGDLSKHAPTTCVEPMLSGICGGAYTIPITIEEFELAKQSMKTCKNCKFFDEHNTMGLGYCKILSDLLDVEDRKGNYLKGAVIVINETFGCIKFERE